MIDPFDNVYAAEFIGSVTALPGGSEKEIAKSAIELTNKIVFRSAIEAEETETLEEEVCAEVWISACLYDAVLNGTDYAPLCTGYEGELSAAVKAIRDGISLKTFFGKKPMFNLSEILQNGVEALDGIIGVYCRSELLEDMKRNGKAKEFETSVIELQCRLGDKREELLCKK